MSLYSITLLVLILGSGAYLCAFLWRLSSRRYLLPCPTWLAWVVELNVPFVSIYRPEVIIEHLDLKEGMSVLDIGCGPGRISIPAAKTVGSKGKVAALDIQDGMLDKVREKIKNEQLQNVQCICARTGDDKMGKNQFDRAVLVTVLGEIPDRQSLFDEAYQALKKGGILSVTEFIFDPHFQTQKMVMRFANKAGFVLKEKFGNPLAFTLNLQKPVKTDKP